MGDLVATINLQPGATVTLSPPEGSENPFLLNGTQLLAAIVFDAEVTPLERSNNSKIRSVVKRFNLFCFSQKTSSFSARLLCRPADGAQVNLHLKMKKQQIKAGFHPPAPH